MDGAAFANTRVYVNDKFAKKCAASQEAHAAGPPTRSALEANGAALSQRRCFALSAATVAVGSPQTLTAGRSTFKIGDIDG